MAVTMPPFQMTQPVHYLLNPSKAPQGCNGAYIHTGKGHKNLLYRNLPPNTHTHTLQNNQDILLHFCGIC